MTFEPHYRISAVGTLGPLAAPVESFSYGLSMARDGGEGGEDGVVAMNRDQAVDIAEDFRSYHADVNTAIAPSAILKQVVVAKINALGNYSSDPFVIDVAPTPGGGADRGSLPQASLCVSFGTERYGPTGMGRFFLPMPSHAVGADFSIGALAAEAVRNRTVQLVDNLNDEPGIDVLGIGVCVSSTKGYNSRVTKVRVGRVIDTMRSRRRSLLEQYTPYGLVAPPDEGIGPGA